MEKSISSYYCEVVSRSEECGGERVVVRKLNLFVDAAVEKDRAKPPIHSI